MREESNFNRKPMCKDCLGSGIVLVTYFTCKNCGWKNSIGMRNYRKHANYAYDDTCKNCGWGQGRSINTKETELNCPTCSG